MNKKIIEYGIMGDYEGIATTLIHKPTVVQDNYNFYKIKIQENEDNEENIDPIEASNIDPIEASNIDPIEASNIDPIEDTNNSNEKIPDNTIKDIDQNINSEINNINKLLIVSPILIIFLILIIYFLMPGSKNNIFGKSRI